MPYSRPSDGTSSWARRADPALGRELGDGMAELAIAEVVERHLADEVRELVARVRAVVPGIGVHVVPGVHEPVGVEHDVCVGVEFAGAPCDLSVPLDRRVPAAVVRAGLLGDEHRRDVRDLGGEDDLTHRDLLLVSPGDVEAAGAPEADVGERRRVLIGDQRERRHALGEHLHHDLRLEPGELGAEAVVDALAERDVLRRVGPTRCRTRRARRTRSGSWFAAPRLRNTGVPAGRSTPPSTVSRVVTRRQPICGEFQRITSSNARRDRGRVGADVRPLCHDGRQGG